MRTRLLLVAALVVTATLTVGGLAGSATGNPSGFKTARPSMVAPLEAGIVIDPILSTGDVRRRLPDRAGYPTAWAPTAPAIES